MKWRNKDVTKDLSPLISSIQFKDYLGGQAADLTISIIDSNNLFINSWYPTVSDIIELYIGYDNDEMMDCGKFWIDEIQNKGSRGGYSCTVRAMSLQPTAIYSQTYHKVYQGVDFGTIAQEIASHHSLKLINKIEGKVTAKSNDKSLGFLSKLANDMGGIIKIERDNLICIPVSDFLTNNKKVQISCKDVLSYSFTSSAEGRYSKCVCKWWDLNEKKLIQGSYQNNKDGGEAVIWEEVENTTAAQSRAKKWLEKNNTKELKVNINMTGNIKLLSGLKVELKDAGVFNDTYYIHSAIHRLSRSNGYTTSLTLKK